MIEKKEGKIMLEGEDVEKIQESEMRRKRRRMKYIFKDKLEQIQKRMKIGEIIMEGINIKGIGKKEERMERERKEMEKVEMKKEKINR